MKFRGVLADMLSRLAVAFAVPPFPAESGVLSTVALTKAAIASAKVGGTGGELGVASLPREVPAPSCPRVLDDI
jgi:NAD-dependent oxidoreductase involved in siderophore biosynthesis